MSDTTNVYQVQTLLERHTIVKRNSVNQVADIRTVQVNLKVVELASIQYTILQII